MSQTKFMLFGVVALMAVGSAVAIIAGKDATPGQFPYFAYLETYKIADIPEKIYRKCGGSIISKQWVLTTAHCLYYAEIAEVHLGLQRIFDQNENGRQSFNVTKKGFYIYDAYTRDQLFINDIALVKLPSPAKFTAFVQPIQISSQLTLVGINVITMGLGLVNEKTFPKNIQYTQFKTIGLKECAPIKVNLVPKNSLICAQDPKSRLCNGDAGGPLISADTGKLVGVAVSTWGDCEVGPQSFTGIYAYFDWINRIVNARKETAV